MRERSQRHLEESGMSMADRLNWVMWPRGQRLKGLVAKMAELIQNSEKPEEGKQPVGGDLG